MSPSRIILVRHGERVDKKNPTYARRSARPHDPPLTEAGKEMARLLGDYLINNLHVNGNDVVILTSPLIRCVQTADGILQGMTRASSTALSVPIYCEPSIMEGGTWLMHDLRRNPEIWTDTYFKCPQPVYYSPEYLRSHISPHVVEHKPFDFKATPELIITDELLREENLRERCECGAKALLECQELHNKVVVMIGHGETVLLWNNAIVQPETMLDVDLENPPYTAMMVLSPQNDESDAVNKKHDTSHTSNTTEKKNSEVTVNSANNKNIDQEKVDYATDNVNKVKACKWVNEWPTFCTPHLPSTPSEY